MKKIIFPFIIFSLLLSSLIGLDIPAAHRAQKKPLLLGESKQRRILLNNRVLATINGQSITMLDVMKKMDMVFYQQYPQYAETVEARYQFYQSQWRSFFQDLINKELIMADAEEHEFIVSHGDVRQEMEEMFGPNIMINLDRIDLTYQEAWEMIYSDIVIRRMLFARANMAAINAIGPKQVVAEYEKFIKKQNIGDEWHYQVLSVRDDDDEAGVKVASAASEMLLCGEASFDDVVQKVLERDDLVNPKSIKISEEYHHTDKELSPAYREVLQQLEINNYSAPIAQTSRSSGSTAQRIFLLKDVIRQEAPSFESVANKIHNQLVQQQIVVETEKYLIKLRKHYHIDDELLTQQTPKDFLPFTLT